MKVYIVSGSDDYEYSFIEAVFDSRSKAVAYMAKLDEDCLYSYSMQEWEVK